MSCSRSPTNAPLVATAVIVALVGIGGLAGAEPAQLDDGTATVDVVSMPERLAFESGRFGTDAEYLRLPDLVVSVTALSGTPRIHYRITVPGMGVDRHETRLVRGEGRLRIPLPDVAFPPGQHRPGAGIHTGRVEVRLQSFSTNTVLANRSVRVGVST